MDVIRVKGAPNLYLCYEGVLDDLPSLLNKHHFQRPAIIHGEASWQAAKPFIHLEEPATYVQYHGDCTHQEVARVRDEASVVDTDVIIGVGGGKVLDIAKATGDTLHLPVILVPTLASNCAAWTPLSVFYDNDGNFLEYTVFNQSTYMVLVEPRIIVQSPVDYLRAGIGDTIAKWYEADVLTRHLESKPIPLEIALHAAGLCRDVLLREGKNAITALSSQVITPEFLQVVETIIMAGGMVGSFGDHYGRISGAHSIHNGLTYVNETHDYLHGDKVAFGVLVQLAIEDRLDEISFLLPYYKELELPISLAELGILENKAEAISIIAHGATKPGESIHLMGISDRTIVEKAIYKIENLKPR
ncbi:iron-containing alcohol dehydrogenase family protein [Ornithinibacillus xuwenensis]|uniref:Iron-containing alcohol dehydrogenase family protein n=1 Tax=Ornithinibacillus xuwenensis TaxID=3144668 RepID=A0ABU9XIW3_9BACI